MRGSRVLACALAVMLGLGEAARAASEACDDGVDNDGDGLVDLDDPDCRADLVLFPLPADMPTERDLSDPTEFLRIRKGLHYDVVTAFTGESFTNVAGERLPYSATVRFLGLPSGEAPPPGSEFLIVFTSLREGPFGGPGDPPPPRPMAGYLLDSFAGDIGSPPFFVRDGEPGQISDIEGSVFFALKLPAVVGARYDLAYEIMLVEPLSDPPAFTQVIAGFVDTECGNSRLDPGEDCDDGNRTDGDCCSAVCRLEAEGSPCDDGDACTLGEACRSGECRGGLEQVCLDGDPCTNDVCDPAVGCTFPPVSVPVPCDDGLHCTLEDTCEEGTCRGTFEVDCSILDDACSVGVCDEFSDSCIPLPAHEGNPCDDGQFCTVGEVCRSGVCAAGTPRDCSSADGICSMGVCSEAAGGCVPFAARGGEVCRPAAGACDAEETCNGSDLSCPPDRPAAAGGLCRPAVGPCDLAETCDGVSPDCPPDGFEPAGALCRGSDDLCDPEETCDGQRGECPLDEWLPDGTSCLEENPCTVGECLDGACRFGPRNPGFPDAAPPADFVFVVDASVSMRTELRRWIPRHLGDFPAKLAEAGIHDTRFAIVRFGTNRFPEQPERGPAFPDLVLPFVTDGFFGLGIDVLRTDIRRATEAGTEAIGFALDQLRFRDEALRNVILYTDEDDDSPATSGEGRSPPRRGIRCYGRRCEARWERFQQRIDDIAARLIAEQVQLHILERPRDRPVRSQYGDPACTATLADGRLDSEATLECLLRPRRKASPAGICEAGTCVQGRRGRECSVDDDCNAYSLQIHLLRAGSCGERGVCTGGRVGSPCGTDLDCALGARAYRAPREAREATAFFRDRFVPDLVRAQVCSVP